ncbi:MAG TPA: RNA methyltransferase [Burkholderiaceae bacterium]|nr:RNA methyltransferase [Burkholderiaceae bacterium]
MTFADRIRFVLIEPSHPGNIGSAARAMKTMGWSDLRIVAPRFADALSSPDALAYASGAADVLHAARVHERFDEAVADTTLVIGFAARTREFAPPRVGLEEACALAMSEVTASNASSVAFVFGTERIGLTNEQAQRCDRLAYIDAEPTYSSLNLAQSVQVAAYELRRTARMRGTSELDVERPDYASHEEIERFHAHFREACVAVGFIDPEHPKKLAERMRRLFARTRLEREEVQLLRGLCKQMVLSGQRKG